MAFAGLTRPMRAGSPLALAAAVAVPLALAGCGSSSPRTVSSAAGTPAAAVARTCTEVGAVLSDGPDPGADPVGYAEAQVLPLRQIHSSDRALQQAISRLAAAYHAFYAEDGAGRAVRRGLSAATRAIDAICPGVTQ